MKKLVFVTGNQAKARDVQKILDFSIEIVDLDLEEIQETDVGKVALHKVIEAYDKIQSPVIVDDVGLSINAWNNFPGPLIKWVLKAGGGNASLLLKFLDKEKNRKATATLAIGYHDGKETHIFIGSIDGIIAKEIRGENGFGWDAVFIPNGRDKTFAEMTFEEKNEISHRRKAFDKLKIFLDSQSK
nr:RdgB/HAM1 family non-canonical purine NTP pyrophosphatase [Candidatus Levybacteria bacterium]